MLMSSRDKGYRFLSILTIQLFCVFWDSLRIAPRSDISVHVHTLLKPKSDLHCNRSATSPRPKFKTIAEVAEVAEESQLGFAVGWRLVGD